MSDDGHRLRDALIRSLQMEPLLVDAEEILHSYGEDEGDEECRDRLQHLLDESPAPAEIDGLTYLSIEREVMERSRKAMMQALMRGASLAEAEQEVLTGLGFEKLGEFRSRVQTHLGGPAEIPDEDLAIYVPEGEGRREAFREAIEEQIRELRVTPEIAIGEEVTAPEEPIKPQLQPEIEELPIEEEEEGLTPWEPSVAKAPIEEEVLPQATIEVTVPSEERAEIISAALPGDAITGLNPVPMMTAALEAAGVDGADFGFLLRYGRYAPEGRKSEFLVGGMGLAELSDRLAAWLKAYGPMEAQVQVVDEGSGELMIYLLGKEI